NGSATRKRAYTSRSKRNGTLTACPQAVPSHADNKKRGGQAMAQSTSRRRRNISRTLPQRCALQNSWDNGPPRTSEKSLPSRAVIAIFGFPKAIDFRN